MSFSGKLMKGERNFNIVIGTSSELNEFNDLRDIISVS